MLRGQILLYTEGEVRGHDVVGCCVHHGALAEELRVEIKQFQARA